MHTQIKHLMLVIAFIAFFAVNAKSQDKGIPTTNILYNTFLIRVDSLMGTSFLIEYENEEYLITARHLFNKNIQNNSSTLFYLYRNGSFIPFIGNIYFKSLIDIAVIKISVDLGSNLTSPNGGSYYFGQDCYFLGFPYNEKFSTEAFGIKVPFIKKATISARYKVNDVTLLLLDGHNNPGFSGGPVVAYDSKTDKNSIIGVISGYRPQVNKGKIKSDSLELFFEYTENSGIIVCHLPDHYIEIINSIDK